MVFLFLPWYCVRTTEPKAKMKTDIKKLLKTGVKPDHKLGILETTPTTPTHTQHVLAPSVH
jgi:hypothetical protein